MTSAGDPRVSVIVPTYNEEGHVDDCLTALDAVDGPKGGHEVIVVDGGSTDATVAIAREHDVRVVEAPDTGVGEARNRAAREAAGDVLVFVDADCWAPQGLLTAAVDRLDEHAAVGAFYEPAPGQGWVARAWLALEAKPAGPVSWVPAGTLAVRREAFEAVGGFDAELEASEDVDLCRRLRADGHTVFHEPAMTCQHLGQADSLGAFFAKEVWRSQSLVESVKRSEGFDAEAATLVLAVYHLVAPVGLFASALVGPLGLAIAAGAVLLPSLAWAAKEAPRAGWTRYPQLVVLLFVYNAARAYSLIRHGQLSDLF